MHAGIQRLSRNKLHNGIGGIVRLETSDDANNPGINFISRQPNKRACLIQEAPTAVIEDWLIGAGNSNDIQMHSHAELFRKILLDREPLPQEIGRLVRNAKSTATKHVLKSISV